ncbi:MAG: helix-turn-helix domain-containing protein [Phycisphaeraceae bacterium]|nr:helix-turn-helix domain-containing protein [Phycisphaeraceae bacterium]
MPEQFGRIPTQVIATGMLTKLNASDLLIYLAVAAFAGKGWTAEVGNSALMRATGRSERTVRRVVNRLKAKGLLAVKIGGGRCLTNRYRLLNPVTQDDRVSGDKPGHSEHETRSKSSINPVTLSDPRSEGSEGSEGFSASRTRAVEWPTGEFQRELPTDPTPEEAERLCREVGL